MGTASAVSFRAACCAAGICTQQHRNTRQQRARRLHGNHCFLSTSLERSRTGPIPTSISTRRICRVRPRLLAINQENKAITFRTLQTSCTLLLLAASPFWHWGAWHAPPQDAHTFQRLSPLESQWLENPSYFSIFIFFWLPSFFWPLHKSSTASLSTSSKLHFLTSLLQQERSLLLAPLHRGAPTKAPCKNSLSPLMDDMEPAPGLCQGTAWPPGWHNTGTTQ